jgi:N-terminal domain of Peptidase_S41 in eukaryotic IRBP
MPNSRFPAIRTQVVQDIARLAREKYVYPETGEKLAFQLQAWLAEGKYDDLDQEADLALRLTLDLQSISNDKHWSVIYNPGEAAGQVDPEKEPDEERKKRYL